MGLLSKVTGAIKKIDAPKLLTSLSVGMNPVEGLIMQNKTAQKVADFVKPGTGDQLGKLTSTLQGVYSGKETTSGVLSKIVSEGSKYIPSQTGSGVGNILTKIAPAVVNKAIASTFSPAKNLPEIQSQPTPVKQSTVSQQDKVSTAKRVVQDAVFSNPVLNPVTDYTSGVAQKVVFGGTSKDDVREIADVILDDKTPWYKKIPVWGYVTGGVGFVIFLFLLFTRKRR